MRRVDLERPHHGLRRLGAPADELDRARDALTACAGGGVICFASAAALWGMPLPRRLQRDPRVHVAVPAPRRAPKGRGVIGHKLALREHERASIDGVALTSPERTWCDLGAQLDLDELVAAGDRLIHWRHGLSGLERLVDASRRYEGRRGTRTVAAALPLLHARSDSPAESGLRLLLGRLGFDDFAVNHEIPVPGRVVPYRVDLAFVRHRLAIEYQGPTHLDPEQRRRDLTRFGHLRDVGWEALEVFAPDVRDPARLAVRIRAVLASRPRIE